MRWDVLFAFVGGMVVGMIPTIIVTIAAIWKIKPDETWRKDK